MELLIFNNLGLTTPTNDFSLAANSFFDVFVDLSIPSGDFLVFQGRSCQDVNCTTLNGNFIYEHEHTPVPEPTSTLSLLALGTLGAASTLKRRQK